MIARSLRWRLLLAAAAAILMALAIAWVFMTLLFGRHLERQLEAEMTRGALVLVAGLELSPAGGPVLVAQPVDPRLDKPAGGAYWQVSADGGTLRSRSLWDAVLPVPADVPTDAWRMRRASGPFGHPVAVLERRLVIESDHAPVVVQLAQDTAPLTTARAGFARELAVFLAALWAVLSAAAWLQVTLGLLPLGRIRGDLVKLENDADARLPPARLREIQPLVQAINSLADARAGELELARRRAADLAHGLKTPLAALAAQSRRAREAGADAAADGMDRAIAAIGRVVDAELARMRLARVGRVPGASAGVRAVVERLVNVLEHTEQGGQLAFAIDIPAGLQLAMQEEHLSEVVGAVLENAVKYARRQVRITAAAGPEWTSLCIEDDGAGIPPALLEQALVRGRRLDEAGGSGLGLSIARELVEASHGRIALDASPLGGLRVRFAWGAGTGN
ncbi:sensor histidine kinase [Luteimonas lutimaris]|uniref:histidine kinase n=1 Tax=Luteimonas lutimaris TaxID=698645 RepID=A0ABP7MBA2_9GAMM